MRQENAPPASYCSYVYFRNTKALRPGEITVRQDHSQPPASRRLNFPRASFDQHDLRVALSAQQIEGHIPPVPMESEVEARLAETQLVQGHMIQKGGHDRIAE